MFKVIDLLLLTYRFFILHDIMCIPTVSGANNYLKPPLLDQINFPPSPVDFRNSSNFMPHCAKNAVLDKKIGPSGRWIFLLTHTQDNKLSDWPHTQPINFRTPYSSIMPFKLKHLSQFHSFREWKIFYWEVFSLVN